MKRSVIRAMAALLPAFVLFATHSRAQSMEAEAREVEWQSYKLPASDFARFTDESRSLVFRVPVEWKQQGNELKFANAEGVGLQVVIETIPDGIPLRNYVAAMMQAIRGLPGGPDSVVSRRAQISGLEAREILFEIAEGGAAARKVMWTVVAGPRAISFLFDTPAVSAAQTEPYFKAVVQSAIITNEMRGVTFDAVRSHAFKQGKPARVDEVQSLAEVINSTDVAAREKAVARLAAIFAASPETAIDLMIDRRPMVRAAAIEAIGLSGNRSLFKFIIGPLRDQSLGELDLFVFEQVARAIAKLPDAVALLREETDGWSQASAHLLVNATAFLDEKARVEIVSDIFGDAKLKRIGSAGTVSVNELPPAQKGAKPSPTGKGAKPPAKKPNAKAILPPPPFDVKSGIPIGKREDSSDIWQIGEMFNGEQFAALSLLRQISPERFKTPLAKIIESKNDRLIAAALEIALERRESLDVETLFKLLASADEHVQRYAALNLGASASEAHVERINEFISKAEAKSNATADGSKIEKRDDTKIVDNSKIDKRDDAKITDNTKLTYNSKIADNSKLAENAKLIGELRASIKKIRLRGEIAKAATDTRDEIFKQAMSDEELAEWVWQERLQRELESPAAQSSIVSKDNTAALNNNAASNGKAAASIESSVSPLGENLFPSSVKFYVALPNPAAAINRLGDSLNNLRLETARGQADLVLILSALKEQIRRLVVSPPGADAMDYAGIDMSAPIAMAGWRAEGAPRIDAAERRAVVLKVNDRDRFERLLSLYQIALGNFRNLPDYVSIGARLAGFAPAILPLGASAYIKPATESAPAPKSLPYYAVGRDECMGYEVKIFERRIIETGRQSNDAVYLAYVGTAAVLAPDKHSLRDALARLESSGGALSANADFKRAIAAGGDVVYMSRLDEIFPSSKTKEADEESRVSESGSLKFSNAAWENVYNLSFKQSDWAKAFEPFNPRDLAAPRELLPRFTVAYLFTKLDLVEVWKSFASDVGGRELAERIASAWQVDFEKDVLGELGPEAGAALLRMPRFDGNQWDARWVIFFKLRSDKLARAHNEGKLFKQGAELLIAATIKNGYLVFADSRATLDLLDHKEKLEAARDFQRASKAAPDRVIAFGGYTLEAAFDEIKISEGDAAALRAFANLSSIARAFHSQNFYAVANESGATARMTVSLDREGRYSVAELSSLAKDLQLTYAMVEPFGIPIADAKTLRHLKLKVKAKGAGAIERIKEDLTVEGQMVEKTSESELIVTVHPRRAEESQTAQLPISSAELAPFLQPTREIRSDDAQVMKQAREIAGDDRDALSVARKLADWTFKNLEWRRVDGATASETLATREADCVEFSQLFVAMARSLGLPARMVFGMAYGDGAFGGHAWVEVYAGRWIELDPTFGVSFADAGHVRGVTNELANYAALNLVSIEILEAPRETFDYQRDAMTLAERLVADIGKGEQSSVAASLDLVALVDELEGAGAWAAMSDRERDHMAMAFRKAIAEITSGLEIFDSTGGSLRLLRVDKSADRAEAIVLDVINERLVKLKLALRGEAWMLAEVTREDTGFRIIADYLRRAARVISDERSGTKGKPQFDFIQTINGNRQNPEATLAQLNEAINRDPKDRRLRNLKACVLLQAQKADEAMKLWSELGEEEPPLASALFALAEHFSVSEKEDEIKKAIDYYERYAKLEPYDPRPRTALAELFAARGDAARAEAEYRAAIKVDPRASDSYISLAALLAGGNRLNDAVAVISEAEKMLKEDDFAASLFMQLYEEEKDKEAELLAGALAEKMAKSADANLYLAYSRMRAGRAKDAIPALKKAIAIKADYGAAYVSLSECHRKMGSYAAALQAADAAIKIDAEDDGAHYERACSLARLARKTEAITSLKRAIELEDLYAEYLADEEDLKPLALMPEFKKLLPKESNDK